MIVVFGVYRKREPGSLSLKLFQVLGFTGSEALFNAFRICSCLEATDKYVPLPSKRGTARTNKDWRFALKLHIPEPSFSQALGLLDGYWRECPAFNSSLINSRLCTF